MNERKRLELASNLNASGVVLMSEIIPRDLSGVPIALELLKDGSIEKFEACEQQYTISIPKNSNSFFRNITEYITESEKILDILNDKGKEIYNLILEKVERKEFKDTFTKYAYTSNHSGAWFPDKKSKFYDTEESINAYLNTFKNVTIVGNSVEKGPIQTSVILFFKDSIVENGEIKEYGWCYSKSGSLYRLGIKTSIYEMNDISKKYYKLN